MRTIAGILLLLLSIMPAGCGAARELPADGRTKQADQQARRKWGKGLDELQTLRLVAISAHNQDIQNEFEWAFSLHHAVEHGQKVTIEWRDVGGGGSAIESYLRNVYGRTDSSGIDLLWGGGDLSHRALAGEGLLEPLSVPEDVLENVPAEFGGVELYGPELRWFGSTLSGFGFIYNTGLLKRMDIAPPRRWEDLADPRFAGLIALADPTQSGSAAATYLMIVRSGKSWPDGWAKLLGVLANAKRFTDSAGAAANAPALGEAALATCIDFYGIIRVVEAPEELVYVSPPGQTVFTPDPIAILKNPPHRRLAQRFVEFVLSRRGQALWALKVGAPDGPVRNPLGRLPIRRDVYQAYAQDLLESTVNPYQAGQAMEMTGHRTAVSFSTLRLLVGAAAIDNLDGLRQVRQRLIATNFAPDRLEEFQRLPENVSTLEKMAQTGKDLKDPTRRERIVTDWERFFREKYRRVAR